MNTSSDETSGTFGTSGDQPQGETLQERLERDAQSLSREDRREGETLTGMFGRDAQNIRDSVRDGSWDSPLGSLRRNRDEDGESIEDIVARTRRNRGFGLGDLGGFPEDPDPFDFSAGPFGMSEDFDLPGFPGRRFGARASLNDLFGVSDPFEEFPFDFGRRGGRAYRVPGGMALEIDLNQLLGGNDEDDDEDDGEPKLYKGANPYNLVVTSGNTELPLFNCPVCGGDHPVAVYDDEDSVNFEITNTAGVCVDPVKVRHNGEEVDLGVHEDGRLKSKLHAGEKLVITSDMLTSTLDSDSPIQVVDITLPPAPTALEMLQGDLKRAMSARIKAVGGPAEAASEVLDQIPIEGTIHFKYMPTEIYATAQEVGRLTNSLLPGLAGAIVASALAGRRGSDLDDADLDGLIEILSARAAVDSEDSERRPRRRSGPLSGLPFGGLPIGRNRRSRRRGIFDRD